MPLRIARRCRVVVDNDWAGDPDGLVALAHHLLSPGHRVDAITSSLLSPRFGPPAGMASAGAALAEELVDLVGVDPPPPVHAGTDVPFGAGEPSSAASRAIIEEALREDDLPLVVVCGGPLTNVATALRDEPRIAPRMRLAWVGGSSFGQAEYNHDTDPAAAELVRAAAELTRWEFPLETYRQCAVSVAELEHVLEGSGRLGAWLWRRFVELPLPDWLEIDAVWPLGDSCLLVGTALSAESSTWLDGADGRSRVCTDIDARLLLGDMVALFERHARADGG
ncbi:nucleoside hydrolase [Nocardioides sp. NPDC126508]